MKNILIMLGLSIMMLGCGVDNNCALNDKNLTKQTQTGANTMSCKIDGQVWVGNGANDKRECVGFCGPYNNLIMFEGSTSYDCARLEAYISFEIDTAIYTFHNGVRRYKMGKVGKFGLNKARVRVYKDNVSYEGFTEIDNKDGDGGWVEITRYDTTAKVISGRFEFIGYKTTDNITLDYNLSPIRVTEGRFDWNYSSYFPCYSTSHR